MQKENENRKEISTPDPAICNPLHSAIGCIAFLKSTCLCGETLYPADEMFVAETIEQLRRVEKMLYFTGQKARLVDGFPRRARVDLWSAAEKTIQLAVEKVEETGADERLTDAVMLLAAARERVADYLEDKEQRREQEQERERGSE